MCATQPIARTVRAAADKEENRGKPRFCFYMPVHEASAGLFGTGCPVHTNCVSVFALTGRLLLCTDPAGCANCRRRVRPFRAGSFSLNLSGDSPSADGGSVAAPAAGRGTFPPSADGESPPLRFSEKLSARIGRTRLRQFAHPAQPVQRKRCRPDRAPADAVCVPRLITARKRKKPPYEPYGGFFLCLISSAG